MSASEAVPSSLSRTKLGLHWETRAWRGRRFARIEVMLPWIPRVAVDEMASTNCQNLIGHLKALPLPRGAGSVMPVFHAAASSQSSSGTTLMQ
jgi:hypothetical protein